MAKGRKPKRENLKAYVQRRFNEAVALAGVLDGVDVETRTAEELDVVRAEPAFRARWLAASPKEQQDVARDLPEVMEKVLRDQGVNLAKEGADAPQSPTGQHLN